MTAHIMGLPIEESVVQLASAGAVMMTVVVIAGRTGVGRLRRRLSHRPRLRGQDPARLALKALTEKQSSTTATDRRDRS